MSPDTITVTPRLDDMIDNEKLDDLSLLYLICPMAPAELSFLCRSLKASVRKRGAELNSISKEGRELSDSNCGPRAGSAQGKVKSRPQNGTKNSVAKAHRWVEDVLKLIDKFDRIWEASFKNDSKIERSLSEVTTVNSTSCGG